MEQVINVNNRCSVTLTKPGAKWLNSFNADYVSEYRRMIAQFGASDEEIEKAFPTNYKEGDVLECLTWELMRYFGGYFLTETSAPFVNNEINFL
jgi:hypothetical protein